MDRSRGEVLCCTRCFVTDLTRVSGRSCLPMEGCRSIRKLRESTWSGAVLVQVESNVGGDVF